MNLEWITERIDPPFHAVSAARDLLPIIFSGRGDDEAVDAAETFWVWLEDRSRLNYCYNAWVGVYSEKVHPRVWSHILKMTWLRGKSGSLLTGVGIRYLDLHGMFKDALPEHLMEESELSTLANLPDTFTAYRGANGISIGKARRGMSWTLDASYAAWFANGGGGEPLCISATIHKSDVLAYFEQESEVVIPSGRNRNVQVVPVRRLPVGYKDRAQLLQTNVA